MFLTFVASMMGAFVVVKMTMPRLYTADMKFVQSEYYKTKESAQKLKTFVDGGNAQLAKMKETLAEYEKELKAVRKKIDEAKTPAAKNAIAEVEGVQVVNKIKAQRELMSNFARDVREKLNSISREEVTKLRKDILAAAQVAGMRHRALYVFDVNTMMSALPTKDVSKEIITLLNSRKNEIDKASKISDEEKAEIAKRNIAGAPVITFGDDKNDENSASKNLLQTSDK